MGIPFGKSHIQDLLNHTINNTTEDYAVIDFHINVLYFINEFRPEDLDGMAFTPFFPPIAAVAAPATTGIPAAPVATAAGPSPLNATNPHFNEASLPIYVRLRYQLNKAANSVMTSANMGSFIAQPASQNFRVLYYQVQPTVYVTRSGELFILGAVDSKLQSQFVKNAPTCNAWVPTCIRRWYVHFMQHAMCHTLGIL